MNYCNHFCLIIDNLESILLTKVAMLQLMSKEPQDQITPTHNNKRNR